MEMKLRLPDSVQKWKRGLSAGAYWAKIETDSVVYDRVAVVDENALNITVEYPRSKGSGHKIEWRIARDVVARKAVVSMMRYVD